MNESRRNMLWSAFVAGLSSFLTLKWVQAAPTEDHTRVSPKLAAKLAKAPNYDVDEVLMVAMGGTIPNQRNTCYYRGNAGDCNGDGYDKQHKTAWHSTAAPGEIPDGVYPRLSGFAVATEMLVGTIDEICEDFKQKLIAARQTIRDVNTPELNECFGWTPEHQVTLKALRDQYQGSNPAAAIPEDHAGMVRKVLERQAELDKQSSHRALPITKPQWVWLANHYPEVAVAFLAYGVDRVWVRRDKFSTVLSWDVIFDKDDPCRKHFYLVGQEAIERGEPLVLHLTNPNPWTNPELMSKELFKPKKDYNEAITETLQKVGWTKENGY